MLDVTFRTQPIKNAYNYWLSKTSRDKLPARHNIDPAEMIAFLPNLILMDVKRLPLDFRYRLIGTHVASHLLTDLTNRWMSEVEHQKPPSIIWNTCKTVVETAQPIYPHTPYVGPKKDIVDVEDILLPLAKDGINVDMLLIAISYVKKSSSN